MTFSSEPPGELRVLTRTFANSVENWVCSSLGNDCSNDVFLDFSAPVTNLRFVATLVHSDARAVTVRLSRDGELVAEQSITGTGDYRDVIEVNLGSHAPADGVELVDIDDYYGCTSIAF